MTQMFGADPDALERVGAELGRVAGEVRSRGRRLQRALNAAPWHGRGADRFRDEFAHVHLRAIEDAASFLDRSVDVLRQNAREQREASSAFGGTAGGWRSFTGSDRTTRGGWLDPESWIEGLDEFKDRFGQFTDLAFFGLAFIPLMGRLPGWLVGADDWTALRLLGTSTLRRLPFGGGLSHRAGGLMRSLRSRTWANGTLKPLSKAATWGGVGLSAVTGGLDVYLNQRKYGWGDSRTVGSEIDGTLSTGFSLVPGGGIAYSVSRNATGFVYTKVDNAFDGRISDNGFRDYTQQAYGVTDPSNLSPSEIAAVNRRYSGWSGLYHSTKDSIIAGHRDQFGALSSAGRWVGGLFD